MSMIGVIRDFVSTCPVLEDGVLNVGFLGDDIGCFMVDMMDDMVLRQYCDGGQRRAFGFMFASRRSYGGMVRVNLQNADFYEQFASWLDYITHSRQLPDLGAGRKACCIESVGSAQISQVTGGSARYGIPCRVVYDVVTI